MYSLLLSIRSLTKRLFFTLTSRTSQLKGLHFMFPDTRTKLLHIRCPEEKEKGICSRRDICIFTHTSDSFNQSTFTYPSPYLPQAGPSFQFQNQAPPPLFFQPSNAVSFTEDQYDPTNPSASFDTAEQIKNSPALGITTETLKALSNFLTTHQMNKSNQTTSLPSYQPMQPSISQLPSPSDPLSFLSQVSKMQHSGSASSSHSKNSLTSSQISETLDNLKKYTPAPSKTPPQSASSSANSQPTRPAPRQAPTSIVKPNPPPALPKEPVRKAKTMAEKMDASSEALMSLGILKPIQKKKPKKVEVKKKPEDILDMVPKNERPTIPYMLNTYAPSVNRRPMLEAFLKLYLQHLKPGETYKDAIKKAIEIENTLYCDNVTLPTYKTSCSRKFVEVRKSLETPAAASEPVNK